MCGVEISRIKYPNKDACIGRDHNSESLQPIHVMTLDNTHILRLLQRTLEKRKICVNAILLLLLL